MCGLREAVAEAWYGVQSSSVKRVLTIINLNRAAQRGRLFLAWGMSPSSLKRESREININ